jgi:hypothetical protein
VRWCDGASGRGERYSNGERIVGRAAHGG